ncbi:syntaxin-7 [Chironomus tepperi]|uniref:syntaxin-7 n=1 Tax=Chironomus tepperi TaxID=113505 RepID=UPI00391F29BF
MNSTPNYGSIPSTSTSFSPTEFLILKEQIHSNLVLIKRNANKLDKIYKAIGSKSDTPELRNKIQGIQKTTNEVIRTTSSLIKKLNSIVKFSATEKAQKIQTEKIISEFNLVVQRFLQSEKLLNSKIRKALLVNVDDEDVPQSTTSTAYQQQQIQIQQDIRFDNDLLVEREHNILKIEDDVNEISQIMSEISTLIQGQGEMVETIENTVADVETNVEEGTAELRKASSYQQKIRKKAFIIFCVFLIIAIIVAISIYRSL